MVYLLFYVTRPRSFRNRCFETIQTVIIVRPQKNYWSYQSEELITIGLKVPPETERHLERKQVDLTKSTLVSVNIGPTHQGILQRDREITTNFFISHSIFSDCDYDTSMEAIK